MKVCTDFVKLCCSTHDVSKWAQSVSHCDAVHGLSQNEHRLYWTVM